jgi:hypothetical protein
MTLQNVLNRKAAPFRLAESLRRLTMTSNLFKDTLAIDGMSRKVHSFRILSKRMNLAHWGPSAREEHVLLECSDCDVAYAIQLDDPQDHFTRAEWDGRIILLSRAIDREHSCGHPSFSFIHDGLLKAQTRKNSPVRVVPANEFHSPYYATQRRHSHFESHTP